MQQQQQQQQMMTIESLRSVLERKAADFENARQRSVEAAKAGMQDLRALMDFVESSITREIEEAFEINRFADALNDLNDYCDVNSSNTNPLSTKPGMEKLRELALEDAAPQLGPSKRDFLQAQERIISLNNWYSKRPLHLPERIEGRCVGGDSVEVVWSKVEGAVCYHVEQRRPSEGAFQRAYEGVETRYRVGGLCAGARVLFRVRSVVGSGCVSEWSECVEASTPAAAPQYLCAQGLSSSEIAVVWDKVDAPCDFNGFNNNNVNNNNNNDNNDDNNDNINITPTYHVEMRPRNNNNNNGANENGCGFKEIYNGSETRCTASKLESEEEYVFRVRTMAGGRCISMSGAVCGRTSIARPRKLRVRTDSWDAISLSWDCVVSKSGEAVCYVVEMKEGERIMDEGEFTEIYRGGRNKIRKSEFRQDIEYSFRVRSVVRGGETSDWSDVVSIRTQSIPPPSNFSAAAECWDTVALKWDGVVSATGEAVNYIVVMRGENDSKFTEVYRGPSTNCTKTELKLDTGYSFRVRSVCKGGGSGWSDAVSVRTQSVPTPGNFTATVKSLGSVYLTWDSIVPKPQVPVDYLVKMKSESDTKFTEVYRGPNTNCTEAGLKQDTGYSFWVRAVSKSGEMSEWSDAVSVRTQRLFAPSNFTATDVSSSSITLKWDAIKEASFYRVEVNGKVLENQVSSNSFTKDGLFPDTEYSFRVRTVKGAEESEWSDVVRGRTQKAPEFSECVWKKCPDYVHECKYSADEVNPRIATNESNNGWYCTIIGTLSLPPNKITSFSVKVLESEDNDGGNIYIGVAPFDIYQNNFSNYDECGWYFNCYYSTLCSGPPHYYDGKVYGPRKQTEQYVRIGSVVGVVMDTAKGELSFVLNGVNLGVAYDAIPLDKPLVPCIILRCKGDSVELGISDIKEKINSSVPAPSNVSVKNDVTWDSLILLWEAVEKASFYQVEVDGKVHSNVVTSKSFVTRGLLPDTVHSFRVRVLIGDGVGEWSDAVRGRTGKESFEASGWKVCPGFNKEYFIDESNPRIAKLSNYYCTVIGNASIPLNRVTSWNIKITTPRYGNNYIGVAPSDINQVEEGNYHKYGWYINSYDCTLISGPPHNIRNKKYGKLEKGEDGRTNSVDVVIDTTKGELSFIIRDVNYGVAYGGVPLDKPLVPCVISKGVSVELII